MKRLDRYFLWVFTQSLVLVLAVFVTVFLVVDVLLNLDKIRDFDDVARGALLFYSFNLPPILYLLYPFAVFGAGMFALARIIRARELLLLQASGVSTRRALAAIMIPCFLLGALGLGLREFILPDLSMAARESPYGAFEYRKGKRVTVRDDGGNVWFVERYNLDSRTLENVRILSAEGTEVLVASQLRWHEERGAWWSPGEITVHDLKALTDGEGREARSIAVDGSLPFGRLLPADFARRKRGYTDRPLSDLWKDPDTANIDLRVTLWHELWHPFGGFLLLICGVGLVAGRGARGTIRAGSLALLCVVGYEFGLFWFETMAQSGAFPAAVGASITPVLVGSLGVWVFSRT